MVVSLLLSLFVPALAPDQRAAEITEIRLQRTPCLGPCPIDEVVLRPDGTATYDGRRFVERIGRHRGQFDPAEFGKLAEMLEARGFFDLEDRYSRPITDQPGRITSATRGGTTKRVDNYAAAGPEPLHEIEAAILRLVESIEWEPEPQGAEDR